MKKLLIFSFVYILIFSSLSFAENSNPDGILRKPVLTLLIGLQEGSAQNSIKKIGYSINNDASLGGYALSGEILYPTTSRISLIFRFGVNSQTYSWTETPLFLAEENKTNTYNFTFGIRLFTR